MRIRTGFSGGGGVVSAAATFSEEVGISPEVMFSVSVGAATSSVSGGAVIRADGGGATGCCCAAVRRAAEKEDALGALLDGFLVLLIRSLTSV